MAYRLRMEFSPRATTVGTRAVAIFWFVSLCGACETAELSAVGLNVAAVNSAPKGQCKALGQVIGKGGGFGGGWIPNETLVEYAMNDLRNKAAELGANYVHNDPPQLGVGGSGNNVSTNSATVTGTAYSCSGDSSVGKRIVQGPDGGAGFTFGASIAESKEMCLAAKRTWTGEAPSFDCSGPPKSTVIDGVVHVRFCSEKVCRVEVEANPPREKWVESFRALRRRLDSKYGKPSKDRQNVPDECQDAELADCLLDGRATFSSDWNFKASFIRLLAGKNTGKDTPAIRLTYELSRTSLEGSGL